MADGSIVPEPHSDESEHEWSDDEDDYFPIHPGTGRSTARSTARVLRTAQGTMVLRRVYGRAGVPTVVTPNGLYRPGSPGYVSGGLWAAVAPNCIPKNRRGGSRGRRRRLFVDPRTFFGTNH